MIVRPPSLFSFLFFRFNSAQVVHDGYPRDAVWLDF